MRKFFDSFSDDAISAIIGSAVVLIVVLFIFVLSFGLSSAMENYMHGVVNTVSGTVTKTLSKEADSDYAALIQTRNGPKAVKLKDAADYLLVTLGDTCTIGVNRNDFAETITCQSNLDR